MKVLLLTILPIAFSHSIVLAQFAGGSGTKEDPYQVETLEQLQEVRNHPDKHFIQIQNIDASDTKEWRQGLGFNPIGTNTYPFTGTYYGAGYNISELFISYCPVCPVHSPFGLFGQIYGAKIKNTKLVNADVSGPNRSVGGVGVLVGNNSGEIINSCVTGLVSGRENVGGLAGINSGKILNSCTGADVTGNEDYIGGLAGDNSGEIRNSFATGSVSGKNNVGGMVGWNDGQIKNSYASGDVSGDSRVGGLAGYNRDKGVIATCYANGHVTGRDDLGGFVGWNNATMDTCYWDRETTRQNEGIGRGDPDGATGLTTSQMTGIAAHENMSAFDFEKIWLLTEAYPALYWEDVESIEVYAESFYQELPEQFTLEQNYPNPFNPSTQIRFAIQEPTHVNLSVYNLIGQQVATLVYENRSPGRHEVTFDATGLSSGMFIYRIEAGEYVETRSMMLVK